MPSNWKTIYQIEAEGSEPFVYGADLPDEHTWSLDESTGEIKISEDTAPGKYVFKVWATDKWGFTSLGGPDSQEIININGGDAPEAGKIEVEVVGNSFDTLKIIDKIYVEFSGISLHTGDCDNVNFGYSHIDPTFNNVNETFELSRDFVFYSFQKFVIIN